LSRLLSIIDVSEGLNDTDRQDNGTSEEKLGEAVNKYIDVLRSINNQNIDAVNNVDLVVEQVQDAIRLTSEFLNPSDRSLDSQVIKLVWQSMDPEHQVFNRNGNFPGSVGEAAALILFDKLANNLTSSWDTL
jgi:hypothetical protein